MMKTVPYGDNMVYRLLYYQVEKKEKCSSNKALENSKTKLCLLSTLNTYSILK